MPILSLLLAVFALPLTGEAPYAGAPIVLISLDTLRADSVTGFGGAPDATPALAAFAQESILFETAIAASHHTAPSHASLLTGFSPFVHGVALGDEGGVMALPAGLPTLAETLKGAGYATAGFTDGIQLRPERGFDRGFDQFKFATSGLRGKVAPTAAFLDRVGDAPWFVFAHTYRPHAPYLPAAGLAEQVLGDYDGPLRDTAREHFGASYKQVMSPDRLDASRAFVAPELTDAADRALMRRAYEAAVVATDQEFARYLALLKKRGVLERAIVVVTSDHGEAFFEHDNHHHADLYDEVIRVPLLVRLPDGHGAGRRVAATLPSIDIVPTLLELVGVEPSVVPEGRSIARALVTGDEPLERPAWSAWFVNGEPSAVALSLRTRQEKAVRVLVPDRTPDGLRPLRPAALFDLTTDPGERSNLVAGDGARFRPLQQRIEQALARWAELVQAHAADGAERAAIDEATAAELRALGYTGH
jgi:arylsulfatase A-like enzyme